LYLFGNLLQRKLGLKSLRKIDCISKFHYSLNVDMKLRILLPLLCLLLIRCASSGLEEEIPLPPSELRATVVSTNQVDLSWKDNSTNETAYKVERKTDSGNFSEIGSTSKDVTTFSDQTVSLNTTYTYRVYSTNTAGKSILYSNEATVKTISVPTLTTTVLTEVTAIGAKSGGNISSDGGSPIAARGVVWSTEPAPTIALVTKTSDGTGTGAFPSTLTGLTGNTKYYIRAYAINAAGTSYGEELSFTTSAAAVLPSITTVTVTEITTSGAKTGGSITSDGNSPITARGVVWGTATGPTIALATKTSNGSGSGAFVSSITGLAANTKYYVRAYATNNAGTGYGNEFSFTTTAGATVPSITTVSVTEITASGAKTGGNITSDGNSPITARGVVWGTATGPTVALATKTSNGSGSGAFVSSITGLAANTKYYVRAYATNGAGTGYGNEFSFTTNATLQVPFFITQAFVKEIGHKNAVAFQGYFSGLGKYPLARGVVWSTSPNPTIALSTKTNLGAGETKTGDLNQIFNLNPRTKYYLRGYATTDNGTGYSEEITFKTDSLPYFSDSFIFKVNSTSVIYNSSNIYDGGSPIIAKGVIWGLSNNLDITLSTKTNQGPAAGEYSFFESTVNNLAPGTRYYLRGYATTSVGTGYSKVLVFTTLPANTVVSVTGLVWMDRNLGATQIASSSTDAAAFGSLYQWGRANDGHQLRTSATTTNLASVDKPSTGNFIISNSGVKDWRSPQNGNLWQGLTGINNPCPAGFRLPTEGEWASEIASWSSKNAAGAFASSLKLPMAGTRSDTGTISLAGGNGYYWSSSVDGTRSRILSINSAVIVSQVRAQGASVRCIMN
jgi:uncharacterized protein (TIGR02145 family)